MSSTNLSKEERLEIIKRNREKFKPKNDVVFKELFKQGNEEKTKAMISSIIKENIKEIDIDVAKETTRNYLEDKLGILDFRVKLGNNTQCSVEIQLYNHGNMIDRMLYYWSKQFSGTLKKDENYKVLERTISIAILNFRIKELKEIESFYSNWKITETKNRQKILTNKLDLYIIELPKLLAQENKELGDKLTQWMLFINNPDSVEVKEIMRSNEEIKEALEKYDTILGDEELMAIAEQKEKRERDEINAMQNAEEKGVNKSKIEIAKNLLKQNVEIEIIIKATGLTKEEIEKL